MFEFDNGKLSTWLKNYKITPDKSHLSEVSIYFKNGNISKMYKNELRKDDGCWSAGKTIYSEGGKTK